MIAASLFAFLSSSSSLSPVDLRCESLVNPVGIDGPVRRLSWIFQSSGRDNPQVAYEVRAASSLDALKRGNADLWDSGRVDSDATFGVAYGGSPLSSGQRVYWNVTVWPKKGQPSTSSSAYWEIGLGESDWQGKWIGMADRPDSDISAPFVRRAFAVSGKVVKARAYVSAKGLYDLYVDGKRIGHDYFRPGWTDYRHRIQYQTYDLTRQLQTGKHAIGLELGNGWYSGHVGWNPRKNYGPKPMGMAQVEVQYEDGHKDTIVSDESWKTSTGPILNDDLYMGEIFDARKVQPNWATAGFDDSSWQPVDVSPVGDIPLVGQCDPSVEKLEEIKPKTITEVKKGVFVYDLGQNMVGWARLKVSGPSGASVKLRFAEMLNKDGTIYTTNLRGAKATDVYTLAGKGVEVWEPEFTFHGFRYVEVTGYPGTPDKGSITGIVAGTDSPQTGTFECSNGMVNRLWHNIYWGERGNYLEVPTDCPQRDERLGWMGDAEIFCRTGTYNNDIDAFMTKWTQDVVDGQSEAGGFSDVSPRIVDQSDGAPAWGDAGVIVPWTIYRAYGDKVLLADRYPAMRKWIEYIDSVNPDHQWLKRRNNDFGDWLNVQDDTPREVLGTAYFAYSTGIVAQAAHILGYSEDAAYLDRLHEGIVDAFQKNYVDADGKIRGDSQTAYVIALHFGLLTPEMRTAAVKRLVDHIVVDRKNHLSTGFVGVGYITPTLTENGQTDLAYKLLLTDTYPSWLYEIKNGATTIWERWDGYTAEKGFQDPGMNSFNHYAFGSVGEWMYKTVAGIDLDPSSAGYKKIVVHPIPGGDIGWVRASYDSISGRIETSWKRSGNRLDLDVKVPANSTATVYVPALSAESVKEGGLPASRSEGVSFLRMENGFAVFTVGGGSYHFRSTSG